MKIHEHRLPATTVRVCLCADTSHANLIPSVNCRHYWIILCVYTYVSDDETLLRQRNSGNTDVRSVYISV